jgi:hypothetical protein
VSGCSGLTIREAIAVTALKSILFSISLHVLYLALPLPSGTGD